MPVTGWASASTSWSENPVWATKSGSNSATAAANAGSSANNWWPIPAHCEPCPENTNTTPGPHGPSWANTTPGPGTPAATARNPATASTRSAAHTVANLACQVRWWLSVWATAANPTAAPAPSIQSANAAAHEPTRATDFPDTTNVDTTGSTPSVTGTTTSGACSITTWAFVPPIPNEDAPARRGRSTAGQSCPDAATRRHDAASVA